MSIKSKWYVSYKGGCATVMHFHRDRPGAIDAACDLLRQNIDVTEVGPMQEIRDENVVDRVELRRIWRERRTSTWHLADKLASKPGFFPYSGFSFE